MILITLNPNGSHAVYKHARYRHGAPTEPLNLINALVLQTRRSYGALAFFTDHVLLRPLLFKYLQYFITSI
jgi:hypothetical protein